MSLNTTRTDTPPLLCVVQRAYYLVADVVVIVIEMGVIDGDVER